MTTDILCDSKLMWARILQNCFFFQNLFIEYFRKFYFSNDKL